MTLKLSSRFTLGAVDGLQVSELAERAGVAPSTVRFYERAGLLSPARRAANGYREQDPGVQITTIIDYKDELLVSLAAQDVR